MKHVTMVGDKKPRREPPKYLCQFGHRHDTRGEAAQCSNEYLTDGTDPKPAR
jgi:hypothetical protein